MNKEIEGILKHFGSFIGPKIDYNDIAWTKVPPGTWEYYFLNGCPPHRDSDAEVIYLKEYLNKDSGATIRMATGYCWFIYCDFVDPDNKKTT